MLTLQSRIDHLQSVLRVDSSTDRHADGRPNMRKVSLILSSCRLLRQFARVYGGTGNCTRFDCRSFGWLALSPNKHLNLSLHTLLDPTVHVLTPSFMQHLPQACRQHHIPAGVSCQQAPKPTILPLPSQRKPRTKKPPTYKCLTLDRT